MLKILLRVVDEGLIGIVFEDQTRVYPQDTESEWPVAHSEESIRRSLAEKDEPDYRQQYYLKPQYYPKPLIEDDVAGLPRTTPEFDNKETDDA